MSSDAEIIIDVDADTKKVDDKLQSLLDKIANKKIELDKVDFLLSRSKR